MLSKEQSIFFDTNGYIIVENVISEDKTQKYLNLCLDHAEKIGNNDLTEMLQVHKGVPETLEIMRSPKVVGIVEEILGGESHGLQSVCCFKKAGTPSAKYAWNPHQDNSYMQAETGNYIAADIALDDHIPGNGCMYVYSGSHKEPLLDWERFKSFGKLSNNPGNRIVNVPTRYKKIELNPKKGSLLLLHGNVIHGSESNDSKSGWRPILLMAFIRKGTSFNRGKSANRNVIELR